MITSAIERLQGVASRAGAITPADERAAPRTASPRGRSARPRDQIEAVTEFREATIDGQRGKGGGLPLVRRP